MLANTGSVEGTETVQVYVKADREGTPNPQLKGICKVSLKPGESKEVTVTLPVSAFALYDEQAVNRVLEGNYLVYIGGSQPDSRSVKLKGKKPASLAVKAVQELILE